MTDKFLENLSKHSFTSFLKNSKIGLEKESLRVDKMEQFLTKCIQKNLEHH